MRQVTGFRFQVSGLLRRACTVLVMLVLFCSVALADSKAENLKPLDGPQPAAASGAIKETAADPALEERYRAELEKRLAQERESYEGSLHSLWMANAAVWACLLAFITLQALSARKRAAELARLKADRDSKPT